MLFFRKKTDRNAIAALLALFSALQPSKQLLAQVPVPVRKQIIEDISQRFYVLREETKRIVTHSKGFDKKKVKLVLDSLNSLTRSYRKVYKMIEDPKRAFSKETKKRLLGLIEKKLKAVSILKGVMISIYNFELDEDKLRKSLKLLPSRARAVTINLKGFISEMLSKLDEVEKILSVVDILYKGWSKEDVLKALRKELIHDVTIATQIINVSAPYRYKKFWWFFIKKNYAKLGFKEPPKLVWNDEKGVYIIILGPKHKYYE